MKIQASQLRQNLLQTVEQTLKKTRQLQHLSREELNFRNFEGEWTILECIEHLNLYNNFYLPEFEKQISKSISKKGKLHTDYTYKSGWLGNYSANSMLPDKKGKINKMNTFKDKNPIHSALDMNVLTKFIHDQEKLYALLEQAEFVHLGKISCALTLKFLRFKLGDTFRFVINHQVRHLQQVERIQSGLPKNQAVMENI